MKRISAWEGGLAGFVLLVVILYTISVLLSLARAQQQPQQIVFQTPNLAQAVGWVGGVGGQDALVIGDLPDPAFARVLPSRTRVLVSGSLPTWVRTGMEVRYLKGLRGRGMLLIDRRYFVVRDGKGLWTVLTSPEIGMQVAYYLEQLWNLGGRT